MNQISVSKYDIRIGMGNWPTEFCKVAIDGQEIATTAKLFTATDTSIVLRECDYCGCCGWDDVKVRRTSDSTILWYSEAVDKGIGTVLPRERLFEFETRAYEKALGGTADAIPELTQEEFRSLPQFSIPNWEDALYTTPEIEGDRFGKQTLRAFSDAIKDGKLQFHFGKPTQIHELAIGLDLNRHPEMRIEVATEESGHVIRFAHLPCIPLWLSVEPDCSLGEILAKLEPSIN